MYSVGVLWLAVHKMPLYYIPIPYNSLQSYGIKNHVQQFRILSTCAGFWFLFDCCALFVVACLAILFSIVIIESMYHTRKALAIAFSIYYEHYLFNCGLSHNATRWNYILQTIPLFTRFQSPNGHKWHCNITFHPVTTIHKMNIHLLFCAVGLVTCKTCFIVFALPAIESNILYSLKVLFLSVP